MAQGSWQRCGTVPRCWVAGLADACERRRSQGRTIALPDRKGLPEQQGRNTNVGEGTLLIQSFGGRSFAHSTVNSSKRRFACKQEVRSQLVHSFHCLGCFQRMSGPQHCTKN